MKVPVRWLRELVPTELTTSKLAQRLTMAGLAAESIEHIGEQWEKIYVGQVENVEQHPDADRLVLATVDAREHRLTVVTGAPNIQAGQKVALAIAGAKLVDGYADEHRLITLKPSKIRGVRSEGMVCSEKELGLSDEHAGILVLEDSAPVGTPLREYLGDDVIEFEITPNLVHAYSIVGIARELGALVDVPVTLPPLANLGSAPVDEALVEIHAPDLCYRYVGVVIEDITVEPSPAWMQQRLSAAGVRPINNIVDITNYVMLEWGQPLHAFDRTDLAEGRIVVRRAEPGEQMETLDHSQRVLSGDDLVIADADRAVAIAGVMGGVDSEISDNTRTLLLESASFNMLSIRHTARAQRLRTEASSRFERGLDPNLVWTATQRAVALIQTLIPTSNVTLLADNYPAPRRPITVDVPRTEFKRLLGVDYPDDILFGALSRLELAPVAVEIDEQQQIRVTVPTYRSDITLKADVVEEVARMVGYESLPETLPSGQTAHVQLDPELEFVRAVQDGLQATGMHEIITYPMLDDEALLRLDPEGEAIPERLGFFNRPQLELVKALNPLRSEWRAMRPTLLPAMLTNVSENLKYNSFVAVFETGRVYLPRGIDELPDERRTLAAAVAGTVSPASIHETAREADFFDLSGVLSALFEGIGARNVSLRAIQHPSLHPGRAAEIVAGEEAIGVVGEVHPRVVERFGIERARRVTYSEIDLQLLAERALEKFRYRPVARYQPIQQDFAVVVDESIPAGNVHQTLDDATRPLATSINLFDVYRGESIGVGNKSLAFRVTFSAPDRALYESDLDKIRKRLERQLKQTVSGRLRSQG